ncbi:BON domain-containing protein [Acidisoma sp. L85]|uniref:BON domain-containing protein n=1 Tax=Acidisoma sp. L85 TaxID=1641850 RepID=UPI00131C6AC8|nr:BON domain-containing protein [Acidisoma sp. L85]
MSNDAALRRDVEAELEFDPAIEASRIGVAVNDGVVTLTGHVPTFDEKILVERAVQRVKGVKAIAEKIEVVLPDHARFDDEEIARRLASLLAWTVPALAHGVPIKVEGRWVELSGEVDWNYQKQAAENLAQRLLGVAGVTNRITVRKQVFPGNMKDRIAEAFRRNAELDPDNISIAVDGGRVTLSGRVKGWRERNVAENTAWAVPGVTHVVDRLAVGR